MSKWYDKNKKKNKYADTMTVAPAQMPERETEEETHAEWELKLFEVQSFASKGVTSGADGGTRREQRDQAILGIMHELGQFAKEMRGSSEEARPNLARRRLGAMIQYCAEIAILEGTTLDAAMIERVNEMCASDKRYERPASLM
jgi:hypothetical protein